MAKTPLSEEEQLRRNQKPLGLTWEEIQSEIDASGGTLDKRVAVRGISKTVRVIVRVKAPTFYKWAMSIVVDPHGRIDGIDWELQVRDHRGKAHNCSGWHRHIWKPTSLDRRKECLQDFDPKSVKDFILGGFGILNVKIKKGAKNANGRLPLD